MLDRFQEIISEAVQKQWDEQDRIIRQAFQQHFGFPIEQADKSKLDRCTILGSPVQQFRYNQETFLYWDDSEDPEYQSGVNYWRFVATAKYLMV